jgi:glycosyltransferase involved in cell wall biosynthesis
MYLPKLLDDLHRQTFTNFEVIHVDGQSSDETMKRASSYKKKLSITSYSATKKNVGHQRNLGMKKARGEWVLFMDADNRLPNYFLDELVKQITKDRNFQLFTTWNTAETDSHFEVAISRIINFNLELYHAIGKSAAMGAMIGARRDVTQQVTFDEKLKVFEDSFFILDACKRGYRFKILREPTFILSLRRLRKEGTLKMAGMTALLQIRYLQGGDFSHRNYGYEMKGGSYHDLDSPTSLLRQMHNYLTKAPRKQLEQAKKIFTSLIEMGG